VNLKPTTSFTCFEALDIRTGTILEAKILEGAKKKAYQLLIDFGTLGVKKSSAQITSLYNQRELIGKQILAIINFEPKQIGKIKSECLVLGAVDAENNVILLTTEKKTKNGLSIS